MYKVDTFLRVSVFVLGFQFALKQILIIWYPCDWQTAPEPGLQLHCVLLGVGRLVFGGSCLSHFGGELWAFDKLKQILG